MPFLIIILFVVLSVLNSVGKAERKKRREQARRTQSGPAYAPPPLARDVFPSPGFDWPDAGPPPYAPPASGSMAYDSKEGVGSGGSLGGTSWEGMPTANSQEGGPVSQAAPPSSIAHVVKPLTEGGHGHEESSITGVVPCPPLPPPSEPSAKADAVPPALSLSLPLNRAAARRGILYAEILGKPRALQRWARP